MKSYYFDDVTDLAAYLKYLYGDLSPVKLQKTLYFLYATYFSLSQIQPQLPEALFDAEFVAYYYGPMIRFIEDQNTSAVGIEPKDYEFKDDELNQIIKEWIDTISYDIVHQSDFDLVDRSHQDIVWSVAMEQGHGTPISPKAIQRAYEV